MPSSPCRLQPLQCLHPSKEAWAAAWKSAPRPKTQDGGGEEAANFKAAAAICFKRKKKPPPPKARGAPLIPQSYARSTLTAHSPSLCSAKGTGLLDLGWGYFLSG